MNSELEREALLKKFDDFRLRFGRGDRATVEDATLLSIVYAALSTEAQPETEVPPLGVQFCLGVSAERMLSDLEQGVSAKDYIDAQDERDRQLSANTEAQPEVTGAVYVLKDKLRVLQHSIDLHVCLHKSPNHNLRPASDFTPLYPPSAIEGYAQELAKRLVRQKLEEARQACMDVHASAKEASEQKDVLAKNKADYIEGYWDAAIDCDEAIRALMESPHTSVEEPAN